MYIDHKTETDIKNLLINTVRSKLEEYYPESQHMPFHFRLIGKGHYAMGSFLHSISTTFGMSIWEQIAVILAKAAGNTGIRQYKLWGQIDNDTERLIQKIHYQLRKGEKNSNKFEENRVIHDSIRSGVRARDPDSVVDVLIKISGQENYFDITSAKPNMKEFSALKLKLLRWTAMRLSQDKNAVVFTRLAIPYNPYHPRPYERWTLSGLYDLDNKEILIGEEFWNYIASADIYGHLLKIFEETGRLLKPEIDQKFKALRDQPPLG